MKNIESQKPKQTYTLIHPTLLTTGAEQILTLFQEDGESFQKNFERNNANPQFGEHFVRSKQMIAEAIAPFTSGKALIFRYGKW